MEKATENKVQQLLDTLNEGVDITIPRKSAIWLFGSVIAANVATVFVLAGITGAAKKFVKPKVEEVIEEPTIKEKVVDKTADILDRGAQHLRKVD